MATVDELVSLVARAVELIRQLQGQQAEPPDLDATAARLRSLVFVPSIGRVRVLCWPGLSDADIAHSANLMQAALAQEGLIVPALAPTVTYLGSKAGPVALDFDFGGPDAGFDPWARVRRVIEGGYTDSRGWHVRGLGSVMAPVEVLPTDRVYE